MRLVGYADRLSVRAGADVAFHVSSEHPRVQAQIVRLRRGGGPRHGMDLLEEPIETAVVSEFAGRVQTTTSGSFIEAHLRSQRDQIGVALWFKPTASTQEPRPLISLGSLALTVSQHGCTLTDGAQVITAVTAAITDGQWHFVSARIDRRGEATLTLRPPQGDVCTGQSTVAAPVTHQGALRIGAAAQTGGPTFNGVVARPVVSDAWGQDVDDHLARGADPLEVLGRDESSVLDFAASIGGTTVDDRGLLTVGGVVHHLPARGVPGPFWTGRERDFRQAPTEFDGIHLHDDDLADAGWEPDVTWAVPA
ncbi:MAG: large subunit of N,N-dimethylformamidase, partial [Mycobacterium sp.]|nr:large subunit of N,N-dimethylformamidase [Mycobacterium sp.]